MFIHCNFVASLRVLFNVIDEQNGSETNIPLQVGHIVKLRSSLASWVHHTPLVFLQHS